MFVRVRKLKETLATVQRLDERMSDLRTWLAGAEAQLARPLAYHVCHADDIQRELRRQQVGAPAPPAVPFA